MKCRKIKLFAEFMLWEIRRIFRFIEMCLKDIPFLALFLVLWYYFTDFYGSLIAGFFYSLFWILIVWLMVQIVKFEWDEFIEYKRRLKKRK